MKINPMDWTPLAKEYASKYTYTGGKAGLQYMDLYQEAMLGIVLASKTYVEKRGKFISYANKHIRTQINDAIYRKTTKTVDGKKKNIKYFDVCAINNDLEYDIGNPGLIEDMVYLEELSKKSFDSNYFKEIYFYGPAEASKRYSKRKGIDISNSIRHRNNLRDRVANYL